MTGIPLGVGKGAELSPCPFCGGEGHVGTIVYTKSPYVDDQCKDQLTYWQVNCSSCIATIRGIAGYRTEAEAIAAWNQRNNASALLDVQTEAQFLCDRLDSLEWMDDGYADVQREYFGHVEPSLARLKALLQALSQGDAA